MVNKLNKQVYRYIELELSRYQQTQKDLKEALDDILHEAPVFDNNGGKSYSIGKPTEGKAIRMVSNVRIRRLEKTIEAIEKVYDQLDEGKRRLIHLRYWRDTFTDPGVWKQLNIERRTYYYWKNNVIYRLAKELGYL